MAHALSNTPPDIGTIHETIFFTWMKVQHWSTTSPLSNFEIEGRTFEVGERNKKKTQI